jgi:hypothetical protein
MRAGDPRVIETRAVAPVSDSARARTIVARGRRTKCNDDGLCLLYLEIGTHQAIINRLKGA